MSERTAHLGTERQGDKPKAAAAHELAKLGGDLLSKPLKAVLSGALLHEAANERSDKVKPVAAWHQASGHGSYPAQLNLYWNHVNAAKRHHQYVTEYPPVFPGIDKPNPPQSGSEAIPKGGTMPSLNDMLTASRDLNRIAFHDGQKPDFIVSQADEDTFKLHYARETVHVGSQFGLSKDQVQDRVRRIYAFEDGGWGTYFTLSDMPQALTDDALKKERLSFHPTASPIGYNQLRIANTVASIKEHGGDIADRLTELAMADPDRFGDLHEKAQLVLDVQDALTHGFDVVSEDRKGRKHHYHETGSSKHLSTAVQGWNLDSDIGPIIQSQELFNLLKYAKTHNFALLLEQKAASMVDQASAYDVLSPDAKAAAVKEVMALVVPAVPHPNKPELDRPFNDVKDSLSRRFLALAPGVSDLLSPHNLSDDEFTMLNTRILTVRRFGGEFGPVSPQARALLDKITNVYFGGLTGDKLMAAALELANLAGPSTAEAMLRPENATLPTSNFFQRNGYQGNPVTSRRSAEELLISINRIMHGPNSADTKPGNAAFIKAFNSITTKLATGHP